METHMLVRLKRHNPARNHVLRRYTYRGIRFQEDRGWYRVAKEIAEYLTGVHQTPGDTNTPLAFDVCTAAEAAALDERERRSKDSRTLADEPIEATQTRDEPEDDAVEDDVSNGASRDLTTADLPKPSRSSAKKKRTKKNT